MLKIKNRALLPKTRTTLCQDTDRFVSRHEPLCFKTGTVLCQDTNRFVSRHDPIAAKTRCLFVFLICLRYFNIIFQLFLLFILNAPHFTR